MIDKKILAICIMCAAIMAGTVVYMTSVASDGENGGADSAPSLQQEIVETWTSRDCTVTLYDDGQVTVGGNGAMADYPDLSSRPWIDHLSDIRSVVFLDGVTYIGIDVFRNCTSLTSVIISDSVTSGGALAFSGCTSLSSATLGNGITAIETGMFSGCTPLTSITIPDSVTSIGNTAFMQCALTSIIIPQNVTIIYAGAFQGCTSLTSATIPGSVTTIGSQAFWGCFSLSSFFFISTTWNVTSIGENAFAIGGNASPVRHATVYSPNDIADGLLDAYTGSYTSLLYAASALNTYNIGANDAEYGSVSSTSVQIWDGTSVVADGNRLVFTDGQTVTATPTPSTAQYEYAFRDWTFDNLSQTANFSRTIQKYTLTFQVADDRMGTISQQTATVEYGTNIAYNTTGHVIPVPPQYSFCIATPNVGFEFDHWDGVPLAPEYITVASDMTLTVYFRPTLVNLTIQNGTPEYGSIDASGTYPVSMFGTVTVDGNTLHYLDEYTSTDLIVTATPNAQTAQYDYAFVGYDGVPEGGTVYMDTTITALFSETVRQYTLTFVSADTAMGTVSVQSVNIEYGFEIYGSGLDPDPRGVVLLMPDDDVLCYATPTNQYAYYWDHWDGVAQYPDTTTVTGDMTITAYFALTTFQMDVQPPTEYGTIENAGSYRISYFAEFTVGGNTLRVTDANVTLDITFIAIPDPATAQYTYRFDRWLGVPTEVTEPVHISAAFSRVINMYTVTINVNNPDWGSVDRDSVTVPYGTTMFAGNNVLNIGSEVIIATPAASVSPYSFYFDSWSGVGTVADDMTVTANFIRETSYTVTIKVNKADYGTVSVNSVMVPESSEIYADGNRLMRTGAAPNLLSTATASAATDESYYMLYDWTIPAGPISSDVTVTANFLRADVSTVDVMNGQYLNILVPPAYSGATAHSEITGATGITVDGGAITGKVGITADAQVFVYYEKASVPVADWSAYYVSLHPVTSATIPLSQDAEQTLDANGVLLVLGRGNLTQAMADKITPYKDLIHIADIRGISNIQSMPYITDNTYTLVLGDSVGTYTDRTSNHFGVIVIGGGMRSFNVTGFHAYDRYGNEISGSALAGRILNETRTMAYTEIDYTASSNHYNNATCYAVENSTLNNHEYDRIQFSIKAVAGLPEYVMTMIQASGQSWGAEIQGSGFKNVSISTDGILQGIQGHQGTYAAKQTALLTNTDYGAMYSCTMSQSIQFQVFVQAKLVVR